jgi:tetratricopeptide (TPR) repeat protein
MFNRKLITAIVLCGALGAAPAYAAEGPDLDRMRQFIGVMQGYFEVIEATHAVASDPAKSAILQLQKIEEIYKKRGDRAEAIAVLTEVVESAGNDTVRNAAAVMLADALNETGRATQAVEVLREALARNMK